MIIKITLHTEHRRETYASTWEEALQYVYYQINSWAGINNFSSESIAEDISSIKIARNHFSEGALKELDINTFVGNYFKIERLKATESNERIFDYLWKYRSRNGINNGWVNKMDIKEELNIAEDGTIVGTMIGFIKKDIAERLDFPLPDGKVFKYYRIKREHVYSR